ncbi:YunC family protein [Tumebacillus permanentifrigoris]|uniref:Uncharacterized protein YunC (DUF1805 family) n=1 Tax=Tumebacillus permanentifrigoris TaxID=378543 RepID=A0A316DTU6_9BACL|nr:DUF1805 domain-containing protein [Tumebacillus permanentifrigoris]PWK11321.1 uncharacterized protein YunC (DUF1805 family) [Tumebacillus permanentifrigoris]
MINVIPIPIEGQIALGISVQLPKTNLVVVSTDIGYIMCGALDVGLLNEKLAARGIIAARAVGVKTIDELLDAPLESVTHKARELGITPGMIGRDAIKIMLQG